MLEQLSQQLIAVYLIPTFYVSILVTFIFGVRTGWALRDFSLFISIPIVLFAQLINSSSLQHIIVSGCLSAFALGVIVSYLPRWIEKTFLRLD